MLADLWFLVLGEGVESFLYGVVLEMFEGRGWLRRRWLGMATKTGLFERTRQETSRNEITTSSPRRPEVERSKQPLLHISKTRTSNGAVIELF